MSQSFFGPIPTPASVRVSNSGYLFWTLLKESSRQLLNIRNELSISHGSRDISEPKGRA